MSTQRPTVGEKAAVDDDRCQACSAHLDTEPHVAGCGNDWPPTSGPPYLNPFMDPRNKEAHSELRRLQSEGLQRAARRRAARTGRPS